MVHVTMPLRLNGECLGLLLAGQVFNQYPEQLALEHAAKQFGLRPREVWQLARQEHPVKRDTLRVYGALLETLARTFLLSRYHTMREADRLTEMTRLRDQAVAEATERQRAEAALSEADRHKNEFLAVLGHELRNPLAPLRTAVHVLRRQRPDPTELNRFCDLIDRQAQQLTRLVDDLLDVARITSGKVRLSLAPVELATVVDRAVENTRARLDARQQQLTVALPPEPVWLEADPLRLMQVLVNLLDNAAKYTGEGGHVWLTAAVASGGRESPAEITISVRDNGIGIAADTLPHVFDLFAQADRSLNRSEGGLGIGLSMVRSLVELHGGTVQAASAGVGQGSTFVVRLPVRPAPRRADAAHETGNGPHVALSPRRVLVVDDNADAANTLALLLRLEGHAVRTAADGAAALSAVQAAPPDLILLDLDLPGLSGLEVARRVRGDLGLTDVLMVALTGYGQDEDRRRSQQAGCDAHLVKPVDLDTLHALLARAAPAEPLGEQEASAPR
jgi:signal transduction histidine kinase/ActR/RegA family two-component response regulator